MASLCAELQTYRNNVLLSIWNLNAQSAKFTDMNGNREHVTTRLKDLRLRAELPMSAIAQAFGLKGRSGYQRYENPETFTKDDLPLNLVRKLLPLMVGKGDPAITVDEVMDLAGGLPGGAELQTVTLSSLPVLGVVAAGVWLENDAEPEQFEHVPVTPDPRYRTAAQFGVKVRGTSINKIAQDGDVLICVSTDETTLEPNEGDLVIVRRIRHQGALIETTAKEFRKNGHFELWPVSTDPKFQQPIIVPDDDTESGEVIQIAAIVTGVYRPLR